MPATIVSLVPFPIKEPLKPGLLPGEFPMPASTGKPVLLVVDTAMRPQYNENYNIIDFPVPASTVAKSVVDDYIKGQMMAEGDTGPGIFWVDEKCTLAEVEVKYDKKLKEAAARQDRWFRKLVTAADDSWAQHHQHKFIMDLQRFAAKYLNFKREWVDATEVRSVKCPACMTIVSDQAVVCFACHAILNEDKFKTIKFAETAGAKG